ncbi:MAG: hypothetical protein IKV57_11100 [Clostridia bacterium]|nr:hypothetical protein [Clostridia bacterium]
MEITKLDKNFTVETKIEREGLTFFDIDDAPFRIHGVFREGERYMRMPFETAQKVSDGVRWLSTHTAGGRIRFVTDSPYIALSIQVRGGSKLPLFAFSGSIGCDLYGGKRYFGTYIPPIDVTDHYEGVVDIFDPEEREYTINMPLYSGVDKVYVGLKEGCTLKAASDYAIMKPIVYYGSSITHGGCASRPGNNYESIIGRELNCDFINLGFAGNAKGEVAIAEYIAGLDMTAFVYDYDHNAPSVEYYRETHERMFKIIRAAQPDLPIIMMTRPKFYINREETERLQVMLTTYENAIAAGDRNVYCIRGTDLLPASIREFALVDNCHPNDCGFAAVAEILGGKLKEILGLN